ncbi:MAG: peptidoglycan DD-metalloendopeptidase family protein [Clostridia bacterium]|nr:peptidoglycan DD-metalloendopeptidase family protein [Clostridia bacterium]
MKVYEKLNRKEVCALKKLLALILSISSLTAIFAATYAADKDEYIGQCECAISVEDAHGADKITAIENATAQVNSGTSPEKTVYFSGKARRRNIGDGYYTITETSTDMCFNVDTDGADTDYEGIRLTVWEPTEDITQRFRLVMNEDGSYTFYAACSRGGYSRAVGYDPFTETLGLYSADSDKCVTFYIKNSSAGNGMKYIVLSTDETKYLSIPVNPYNSALTALTSLDDPEYLHEWKISNWGDSAGGGEKALYPGNVLTITQGPFDEFSHQEQNAIDMQVASGESITAPFTCRVVAVNEECGNVVWIQSTSEVQYADGTYDYMTCLFMHDDDISDIYVGEIILQGQPFYEMGTAGNAEGEHCHISCFRGEYSPAMKIDNLGPEAVNAWEAFFLPANITVRIDYGFPWIYLPAEN